MDNSFTNNPFLTDQQDNENSPANSGDSPRSAGFNDAKSTSVSSPKRSRRAMQKRVVSVPIRDVEGSRLKGETSAPPSDSWAWRKYGQKPIKGSPYPRGYYRCSSSKGCPARKQVERSRVDPNMLVVTYSCEHNHPWPPPSRNNNNNNNHRTNQTPTPAATTASAAVSDSDHEKSEVFGNPLDDDKAEEKFGNLGEDSLITVDQFGWFPEAESAISTMLESPILAGEGSVRDADSDAAMMFSAREEEDSLFADLGELPEFSLVFRLGAVERAEEERRRCGLRPCCGTTG